MVKAAYQGHTQQAVQVIKALPSVTVPLLANNAVWKYLEGAIGHDPGFEAVGFDDSGWASGPAPFAHNDSGFTPYVYNTLWTSVNDELCIRTHFTVPANIATVTIYLEIDYSGSVYVNGVLLGSYMLNLGVVLPLSTWVVGDNVVAFRAYGDHAQNVVGLYINGVAPIPIVSAEAAFQPNAFQADTFQESFTAPTQSGIADRSKALQLQEFFTLPALPSGSGYWGRSRAAQVPPTGLPFDTSASWRTLQLSYKLSIFTDLVILNTEPTGWKLIGFNDSAWATAMALASLDPHPPYTSGSTDRIVPNPLAAIGGIIWIARKEFNCVSALLSAHLTLGGDDSISCWLNGVQIGSTGGGVGGITTVSVDPMLFIIGLNCLAIMVSNANFANGWGVNPTWGAALLTGIAPLKTPARILVS